MEAEQTTESERKSEIEEERKREKRKSDNRKRTLSFSSAESIQHTNGLLITTRLAKLTHKHIQFEFRMGVLKMANK